MQPLIISGLLLAGTLAAAALGWRLHTRFVPKTGDDPDSSAGGSALGLAATLTAVVLGIVTASSAAEFDQANNAVASMAVGTAELGDLLKSYGPEAEPIREQLKEMLQRLPEDLGSTNSHGVDAGAHPGLTVRSWTEDVYAAVANLKPATELQKELRNRALNLIGDPDGAQQRWAFAVRPAPLPPVFLIAVLVWLFLEFLAFGLSSPRSPVVAMMTVVASVVVSSSVFLILELKDPITGYVRVSTEPLTQAIALYGR
jgi:hypothetical protein